MVTLFDMLDSAARDAEPAATSATRALLRREPRDLAVCQTGSGNQSPALPAAQARMDGDPSVRLAILIPDRETPHRASPISFGLTPARELAGSARPSDIEPAVV